MFGPTGLIRVPGACTAPAGSMSFSGHASGDWQSLGMTVGVIDRLELSANWVRQDDDVAGCLGDKQSAAVVSGKYRLMGPERYGFGLAVGVCDLTNEFNASAFASLEKCFRLGDTSVTGIAGWGEHNSLVDGFFAGAEMNLGRDYRLQLEYDGDNLNGALRAPVAKKFDVGVGVLDDSLFGSATYYLR